MAPSQWLEVVKAGRPDIARCIEAVRWAAATWVGRAAPRAG